LKLIEVEHNGSLAVKHEIDLDLLENENAEEDEKEFDNRYRSWNIQVEG
jgi:hypothetical protein